ncbi:hypothetical protein AB0C18_40175 [Nonomuraea muscovyensis]|uniref:hypothetical protein n=1 Tax=Nonomuraea muscovyensis TaxID=1124761 RepID=UPI0033F1EA83
MSLLRRAGVTVRAGSRSGEPRFDWTDESTWDAALAVVRRILLVPHDGAVLTRPFVRRAKELGAERVVLLSGRGVDVPGYADAVSPIRRGLDAHLPDGVRRVLGRPPRDFAEFVRDAAASGAWRS